MKKLILATFGILSVCAAINVAMISAKSYDGSDDSSQIVGNRTYIVKEYEGKVACFEETADQPFIVTETYVRNLPPNDRKMLSSGFEVVGSRTLSRVLEDYKS